MELNLIAALTLDGAIGNNEGLLYKIPEDLQNYKNLTTGNILIVGSNTYLSLPKTALKNRQFIVLTHKEPNELLLRQMGDTIVHSKEEAFEKVKELQKNSDREKRIFVIGGEQIYNLFIDDVNLAYITWINKYDNLIDSTLKYFPIDKLFNDFNLERETNWLKSKENSSLPSYKFSVYIKEN